MPELVKINAETLAEAPTTAHPLRLDLVKAQGDKVDIHAAGPDGKSVGILGTFNPDGTLTIHENFPPNYGAKLDRYGRITIARRRR